ncbi:MAG: hypothetical protein K9J13_14725 [Saprospiraceae bacterium]|nr:hypothetical protein [Saprospiraceae bacterium]
MFNIFKINKWILLILVAVLPFIVQSFLWPPHFYLEIGTKAISVFFLIYWYYSIDYLISKSFEFEKKINILTKLLYVFIGIYPIIIGVYFFPLTSINSNQPEFYYIIPLQILWTISLIITLIRISKKIKENMNVSGAFWKLLFYPVGIILLHPEFKKNADKKVK